MDFFGVGPLEIFVVIVVAVIVLGPERIPQVAVQLARALRYLRGYANDATSQLRGELAELTREYDSMRQELTEFRASVNGALKPVTDSIEQVLSQTQRNAVDPLREAATRPLDDTRPILEPAGELPEPPDSEGKPAH
jgi:sec-independent protein translocase protein TatB